ncbi:hypothetical protein COXBURSA331_A0998 [Coxiella burnetii RSA 331]|nr:hypothetical protein COXBURSA331_A0998 [Coxiella burnetii RSA 331]EDR35284.1 hypothetical protein COXBURSA334_1044 [Coxiella burnetii Q321]
MINNNKYRQRLTPSTAQMARDAFIKMINHYFKVTIFLDSKRSIYFLKKLSLAHHFLN